MRIIVNHQLCSGHGRCAALAPDIFQLDAEGYNRMPAFEVAQGDEERARKAADNCPERAISVA